MTVTIMTVPARCSSVGVVGVGGRVRVCRSSLDASRVYRSRR